MRDGSLSVSQISGDGYEKRLRRTSYYNNSTLVIYKDKDGKFDIILHCLVHSFTCFSFKFFILTSRILNFIFLAFMKLSCILAYSLYSISVSFVVSNNNNFRNI